MSKLTHEERMAEARNLMGSAQQTRPQGARSSTQGASCSATQVASRPVARGDGRPGTQEAACGNLPRGGAPTENPSAHRSASHGTMEKSSTGRGMHSMLLSFYNTLPHSSCLTRLHIPLMIPVMTDGALTSRLHRKSYGCWYISSQAEDRGDCCQVP